MGLLRTILARCITGSLKELSTNEVTPPNHARNRRHELKTRDLFLGIDGQRTAVALKVSKSVDVRRLSTSTLVAGRHDGAVNDTDGLEISNVFSIHAWNSGVWNTHRLSALDSRL